MRMRTYADYNATAPLRPEARAAVLDALALVGNASSAHRDGARVRQLLETARAEVGALVGRPAREVVFTSGATEANALALTGLLRPGDRLVTSAIEHASILETAAALAAAGVEVIRVAVTPEGELDSAALERALAGGARLASFGLANGEVGSVLAPGTVERLAAGTAHLHLDAAQAVGRLPVAVPAGALLALSAHKLGGPAGIGALVVPDDVPLRPLLRGGAQERGRRAGTENVAGVAGFGAAARAVRAQHRAEGERVRAQRDALWRRLAAEIQGLVRNGPSLDRALPNTLNVTVPGISGDAVLVRLDLAGVSASLGSACAAGSPEPSHVLRAMGRDEAGARGGLRLSLGWASTAADVDAIVDAVANAARAARRGAAA